MYLTVYIIRPVQALVLRRHLVENNIGEFKQKYLLLTNLAFYWITNVGLKYLHSSYYIFHLSLKSMSPYNDCFRNLELFKAGKMGMRKNDDLTRGKLWWLDNWVRASPKLQLLWGVPGLQWSVHVKSGPRMEDRWMATRSWAVKAHWCTWGEKAGPHGLIRQATVAQIAEKVNAGSDRKVSEHTVHHNLLHMGLCSHKPVRVPMLTSVHCWKHLQWAREHQNWTTEQWKKEAWSDESHFLLHHMDGRVLKNL